jgi:hypothetical protein
MSGHDDGDDHAEKTGAEERDEGDGKQDGGDRHQPVHETHDDAVEPANVAGEEADDEADRDADHGDRDADDDRHPRPVHDAAVDVPSKRVRAHPVLVGGRRPIVGADHALHSGHAVADRWVDLGGRQGAEARGGRPDQDHEQQHEAAEEDARAPGELRPDSREGAGPREVGRREEGRLDTQYRILGSRRT